MSRSQPELRIALGAGLSALLGILVGCSPPSGPELVVYVALDREFAEPILQDFAQETGIRVLAKYDIESTKTVGLTTALIAEQARPRCSLFWNNEVLHTLRLQKLGLLQPYESPGAENWPAAYRDPRGAWYGLAARARVLIVNTERVVADERPRSVLDIADPKWRGDVGIAKPLFGTTATHAAILFSQLGTERAQEFFRQVKANAKILSGNKQVAIDVAAGRLAWGLTDTDDAIIEQEKGATVEIIFPDQASDQMGTLFIPNSIALMKNAPQVNEAKRLIDFLLSPSVESRLARCESAQIPVNPVVEVRSRVQPEMAIRWMEADFTAAAAGWEPAANFLKELFATGQ